MKKYLHKINREGQVKMTFTLLLLVYSTVVAIVSHNVLVAVAMFCSTLGDIAIMSNRGVFNDTKYPNWDYGIVFFALAHIMYILAMRGKRYTPAIAFVAFFSFIIILFMVFNLKAKESNITNVAYAVCICCNLLNCCLNQTFIAVIGMIFFIASDIILIVKEKKDPIYQWPIWVTYVTAQVLLISEVLL